MPSPAEQEKELGNAAYQKKDFDNALAHYDKAISLDPKCMIYYTNKAAVYFEMGKYEDSISQCVKAVEIGLENSGEFKHFARAYSRQALCYEKMGNLEQAKVYYNKSLVEHRDVALERKLKEIDKMIKENERLAYVNPEIAEEEKTKGNQLFQKGNYPDALKCYTEAIKRNPDDAKLYSNRAACYTKLMEFSLAVRDCDTCTEKDPSFIKGYLRKGAAYNAMKDYVQSRKAFRKALDLDPDCAEAKEGLMQTYANDDPESARARAMNDPEVTSILSDPGMHVILEQITNPSALREHLKNPDVATKIGKLIEAGVISMR